MLPIAHDVAAIISRHEFAASQFGIAFYDLDKKRMIYQRDADKYFVAASTTKLLTEGTTLALLGPDYRFVTNVYRNGAVDGSGTLNGDIVLRASGDPNLSQRIQPDGTLAFENEDHAYGGSVNTRAVPGDPLAVIRDFAKQIVARGIRRITGHVIVDDSLFPDTTTEGGTGTGLAPIDVNDNVIDLTIGPGVRAGDPVTVTVSPETPYLTIVNKAVTGAPKTANTLDMSNDVADANGNHTLTLTGSVPQASQAILYSFPVTSPRHFAEVALAKALADAGVSGAVPAPPISTFAPPSYVPADVIATHTSPPISEDVKITLKVSDNNHAGTMPYLWGALVARDSKDPQTAGFRLENRFLRTAGLNPADIVLADGEGAFAYIRPAFMVRYLAYLTTQPYYAYLYRGLPILGVDGTLFDIQTAAPAKGQVHAKTGTNGGTDLLSDSRLFLTGKGLAGYMTTRRGHRLAFCVYVNNFAQGANDDITHIAGEAMGELANAAYTDL